MAINKQHLAQSKPTWTTSSSILSPIEDQTIIIQQIIVCNTTASAATFSIFLDNDGTTYDQTTALIYGYELGANDMMMFSFGQDAESGLYLTDVSGSLALKSDTASALTFTINGAIMVAG